MARNLPCLECGYPVSLSRDKFLQMCRDGKQPLCGQCRRYMTNQPTTKLGGESGDGSISLVGSGRIASRKLKRSR